MTLVRVCTVSLLENLILGVVHIGSKVIFVGSIFPMKEIYERINEIILHGREKQAIARSSP